MDLKTVPSDFKLPTRLQIRMTPNPADDQVQISYTLPTPTDLNIEIRNGTGAIVFAQKQANVQSGVVRVDCKSWGSGSYFVYLQYGVERKLEKLVVVH